MEIFDPFHIPHLAPFLFELMPLVGFLKKWTYLVHALKIYTSVQCIQLAMLLLNHIFFSFILFAFFSLDHCLGSGSLDEVKVFKDEDEVDGSVTESHQAELLAEKSSLITESEQVRILL